MSRAQRRRAQQRDVVAQLRELIRWRPAGPIGWAALAAAVLVLLGLSFALVAPLAAGSPKADTAPATTPSPGPHASVATADPTDDATDASPLPGDPATIKTSTLESQLISLINKGRDQAGCDKLKTDGHLRNSARAHSADMAKKGYVARRGSDDSSPQDRMRKAGYKHPKTEDVGSGYPSAQAAYDAWQGDSGQRGALVDCDLKAVGVGVVLAKDGTPYWTADFGT
ncbi:MAG: CAP domain-containing protein [Geminicoccaceae bacterium]